MACVNCSSFNPYYSGGWCDYHGRKTSPNDYCSVGDYKGNTQSTVDKRCGTCMEYGNYYCRYLREEVSPDNVCNRWKY